MIGWKCESSSDGAKDHRRRRCSHGTCWVNAASYLGTICFLPCYVPRCAHSALLRSLADSVPKVERHGKLANCWMKPCACKMRVSLHWYSNVFLAMWRQPLRKRSRFPPLALALEAKRLVRYVRGIQYLTRSLTIVFVGPCVPRYVGHDQSPAPCTIRTQVL